MSDNPLEARVREIAVRCISTFGVGAAVIAIIDGGELEFSVGIGETESGRKTDEQTLFQAASLSKPVTALTVLTLVNRGLLSLDGDVRSHLDFAEGPFAQGDVSGKITMRMLLNHTAGFVLHGIGSYDSNGSIPSLDELLRGMPPARNKPIKVTYSPGTAWFYSGGGYLVVQRIVERVTGDAFATTVANNVFLPLGMNRSTFDLNPANSLLSNSSPGADNTKAADYICPGAAAGGLWTCAGDLATFVRFILKAANKGHENIISSVLIQQMLTSQSVAQYGLGMMLEIPRRPAPIFYHTGVNKGFESYILGSVSNSKGLVILANRNTQGRFCRSITTALGRELRWLQDGEYPKNNISS